MLIRPSESSVGCSLSGWDDPANTAGSSQAPVNGGLDSESHMEAADELILARNDPGRTQWQLFPNPTANRIHIIPGVGGLLNFRLLSPDGRQVLEQNREVLEGQAVTMDLQDLPE